MEILKDTKGFGEKVVALLFSVNIVSFQEVMKRGIEGLKEAPGIGPKKAEAIYNFTTAWLENKKAEAEAEKEDDAPAPQPEEAGPDKQNEAEMEDDAEDQDPLLADLVSVDKDILESLEKNGFQTIAELSVAPLEELTAIEGIGEEEAKSVLEQARQYMENFEQV